MLWNMLREKGILRDGYWNKEGKTTLKAGYGSE